MSVVSARKTVHEGSKSVNLIFSDSLQRDYTFSFYEGIFVELGTIQRVEVCKYSGSCSRVHLEAIVNFIAASVFDGDGNEALCVELPSSSYIDFLFKNKQKVLDVKVLLDRMGRNEQIRQIVCGVVNSQGGPQLTIDRSEITGGEGLPMEEPLPSDANESACVIN